MRGGVSILRVSGLRLLLSSPRAWGCFQELVLLEGADVVFPTCVGVFPYRAGRWSSPSRLPHVRGGVSAVSSLTARQWGSSPRAWGCFFHLRLPLARGSVFPTCVGVFPESRTAVRSKTCLPHVRGGVSPSQSSLNFGGCGLPHVRGGVSIGRPHVGHALKSSPRAWGCFSRKKLTFLLFGVFPTCVGVFLLTSR